MKGAREKNASTLAKYLHKQSDNWHQSLHLFTPVGHGTYMFFLYSKLTIKERPNLTCC